MTKRLSMMVLAMACLTVSVWGDEPAKESAPHKDAVLMSELMRVGVAHGKLVGEPNPPGAGTEPRDTIPVANISGDVTVIRRVNGITLVMGKTPDSMTATCNPNIIVFSRSKVEDGKTAYIALRQMEPPPAAGAGLGGNANGRPGLVAGAGVGSALRGAVGITLTVSNNLAKGAPAEPPINIHEPTFADLVVKHPDEVKKYVMPLFHDAGMVGVFEMSKLEAQHLFSADTAGAKAAGPEMQAKIDDIVKRLDDDAPEVRTAAMKELGALGKSAQPLLKALDPAKLSLQARLAVAAALKPVEDPWLSDPNILLLCVAVDDPTIPGLAKARYEKVTGKKLAIDPTANFEDRAKAVDKIRMDMLKDVVAAADAADVHPPKP